VRFGRGLKRHPLGKIAGIVAVSGEAGGGRGSVLFTGWCLENCRWEVVEKPSGARDDGS